jgi:MoxR-like ATPase
MMMAVQTRSRAAAAATTSHDDDEWVTESESEKDERGSASEDHDTDDDIIGNLVDERFEAVEQSKLLTDETFLSYVRRISEIEPDATLVELLADPAVKEKHKIELVELMLISFTLDPVSCDYIEMRELIRSYIKRIRLKTRLARAGSGAGAGAGAGGVMGVASLLARLEALPNSTGSSSRSATAEIAAKLRELSTLDKLDMETGKIAAWIDAALKVTAAGIPAAATAATATATAAAPSAMPPTQAVLQHAQAVMDERLYGLQHVKTQVLIYLCNGASPVHPPVLGLVGPAGVGKTSVASIVAEILGVPLTVIPAAGMRDVNVLIGHSYTYVGAQPGLVASAVMRHGGDHVIFVDELDKAEEPVQHVFLHMLDPVQNTRFVDAYLGTGVPVDLSRIRFVISVNSIDKLPRPLADRLYVCTIPDYSRAEKVTILTEYEAKRRHGGVVLAPSTARALIDGLPDSTGMRVYARALRAILERKNLDAILAGTASEDAAVVRAVTDEDVRAYLAELRATQPKLDLSHIYS